MKYFKNHSWVFIFSSAILISACSDDDNPVSQAESDLIGVWTGKSFSLDMKVNDTPVLQWYQEELGLTDTEAQQIIELIVEGLADGFSGTIEFKADHTFVSNFGGEPEETGTWQLTDSDKKLTITDTSDNSTTVFDIVTLNSTTLTVRFGETDSGDLDGDGTDENITLTFELTFEK